MKMNIEFDTTQYEFSHGKPPRGRGAWAFAIKDDNDKPGEPRFIAGSMTYGEARAAFRAEVADGKHDTEIEKVCDPGHGYLEVEVCP